MVIAKINLDNLEESSSFMVIEENTDNDIKLMIQHIEMAKYKNPLYINFKEYKFGKKITDVL